MVLMNQLTINKKELTLKILEDFLKILSPFAPHIADELWSNLGHKKSIFLEKWPVFDSKMVEEHAAKLAIQINGKMRDIVEVDVNIDKVWAEKLALEREKIKKYIAGKKVIKVIYVPRRIINLVVR